MSTKTVTVIDNPRRKASRPRYKTGRKKGKFMSNRAIAASRSARKRKRGATAKPKRRRPTINPPRRRRKAKRATGRPRRKFASTRIRSGPRKGQRRGKYAMKPARRQSRRKGAVTVRRRKYRNPPGGMGMYLMNPNGRKRPFVAILQFAGLSAVGFTGAIAARKIPAVIPFVKQWDYGWRGYSMNIATALGLGLLAAMILPKGLRDAAGAFAIGGGVATLTRMGNELAGPGSPLYLGKAGFKETRKLSRAPAKHPGQFAQASFEQGRDFGHRDSPGRVGQVRTWAYGAEARKLSTGRASFRSIHGARLGGGHAYRGAGQFTT